MTIHYRNTKEDYIEINKFMIKNKLPKFNIIHYLYYTRHLGLLYCLIWSLYAYIISKDLLYVSTYLLPCFFTSLSGYLFIDNILAIRLSNSLNKIVKQKPNILENKTITIKDDSLEFSDTSNKNTQFSLKDICRVVENKYNVYIFFNEYKYFQVIPYSSFENINHKNQFIKTLSSVYM